jgi:hypothetical protein
LKLEEVYDELLVLFDKMIVPTSGSKTLAKVVTPERIESIQ